MSDTEVLPGQDQAVQPVSPTSASQAGEGAAAPPKSLRETLSAAFAEDAAKQSGQPAARAGAAAPERAPAAPADGGLQRNELGQFVKTSDKAAAEPKTPASEPRAGAPKAPTGGAEAPKPEAIAPATWSPAAKAVFGQLPEVVRQEVLKREQDWNSGQAQRSRDAERLNRLHEALAPYAERFQLAGITEAQGVQQLLAASDYLKRDPVNALIYLAQTHGVDPRYLAQVFSGAQGQPQQGQPGPEYQQLYGEFQALKQSLDSRDQAERNAQYQQMLTQVDTFAKDPAHPYFENVRVRMAQLSGAGMAKSLEEAYQQAIWADPQIQPLLIQQQLEAQQAAAAEAAKAKAAQARHASGSITGSPSPGVVPGGLNGSKLSLHDELRKNFQELSGL